MTMRACFCVVCFVLIMAGPARVAEGKDAGRITLTQIVGLNVAFTDNVFELDEDGKDRLEYPDQEDVDTGRMFGMDAIGDVIFSPELGFEADMGSPFGGSLSVSSSVTYHIFYENSEKTYPEINISLDHDVGDSGRISWSWTSLNNYFKSNELASVNDENDNGNISGSERVYAPALYDEYETALAFKMRLYKNKHSLLSEVTVAPEIGLSERSYEEIFSNRDRSVLFAGFELTLTWVKDLDVEFSYTYDDIGSPNGDELVLYDETEDDNDVNDDGSIDRKAVLVTRVDRSCRRHTLGFQPVWALSKKLDVFAGYEWRRTEYLSDNILDESHYGASETRHKVSAGMSWEITRRLSAELSGSHLEEKDGEGDGYTENAMGLQVEYSFP